MKANTNVLASTMNYAITQRPYDRRTNHRYSHINGVTPVPVVLKPTFDWSNWPEVTVKFRGIPQNATTYSIWSSFQAEGNIIFIEMYDGSDGRKDGNGKLRFCPPPKRAFWEETRGRYQVTMEDGVMHTISIQLDQRRPVNKVQSPIKKHVFYNPKMMLRPSALDIGIMVGQNSMMSLQDVLPSARDDMSFTVDLKKLKIVAAFKFDFKDPRIKRKLAIGPVSDKPIGKFNRTNSYMFEMPFGQLKTIRRADIDNETVSLLITLESPPQYYRRREDPRAGHAMENPTWSEFDTWYRQTDIVYDPYRLQTAKVTLQKEQPEIDIGRWTTYLFTFKKSSNNPDVYIEMKAALQDYNVDITVEEKLTILPALPAKMWSIINPPDPQSSTAHLERLRSDHEPLPFEVRYQLEVCISRNMISEYNITRSFIRALAHLARDSDKARNVLEYVAEQGKRIYDPISIFDDPDALAFSPKTEIPHYCAYARKATITPSTILFSSPTVETTNRVLRHYAQENKDGRFLRVQFTDEVFEGRINACADKQRNDEIFTRVYRTLYNGIQIGERHYQFLAFGNSQFRENGAYFFCPTAHLSCDDIRMWMGNFSHIKVVAKYAARLGQCFSTTRAINGLSKPTLVKIPDIERNGFCFTDGVGKISPFMAAMIAAELHLAKPASAFQFRLGGCKGIVSVWPDVKDKDIHIRPSQQKFAAIYNGLEIIRCAKFSSASLNRQTISILSSLGVPDDIFLKMLKEQLAEIQSAMSNDDLAINLLYSNIDDTQMTLNIAAMIRNGFMAERDPFVHSLLHLWRAWSIKLLKEKAKIIVHKGAFVLGCVDETATLKGHTTMAGGESEKIPMSVEELPEIFIQVPDKQDLNRYNVIEGICLVGRNPSLHPGDLRVVKAVNVPALHHLKDVVVFPQTGDRDIPGMCSGGDLDGDDFFVLWDKDLQPREWNCEPMDFTPPQPKEQQRAVQVTDLMKFFVRFMKNDALPTIAHAHMAQSDVLDDSVKDSRCVELAALHSKAVDYVKTGQPAEMTKRLRPRKWPHYMEKKFKSKDAQYHSSKILGQLYDAVESANFVPRWEEPFDRRILRAFKDKLNDSMLKIVRQTKSQYDTAMRRILANQDIKTEFEVWTAFVLSKPRVGSDYKQQEEVARISETLKDQFKAICIDRAGGNEFTVLAPFVVGMYKVTKEELDIALAECRATKVVGGRTVPKRKMEPKSMPLISFPWLFEKELGRIATGVDATEDSNLLPLLFKPDGPSRKRQGGGAGTIGEDFVVQEDGAVVHRGEELDLFKPDLEYGSDAGEDGSLTVRDEYPYTVGESGEVIMAQAFNDGPDLLQFSSGTGLEDVVPRTELDGLTFPFPLEQVDEEMTDQSEHNAVSRHRISPNVSPVNDQSSAKGEIIEEVEEEIVEIVSRESPLEMLARMAIQDGAQPHNESIRKGVCDSSELFDDMEEIEEIVEVFTESALEKLMRMTSH